jgi:hypothetical protein
MQLVAAASLGVDLAAPGCRVNTFNEKNSIFSAKKYYSVQPNKKESR